jgi:hypothetical protein
MPITWNANNINTVKQENETQLDTHECNSKIEQQSSKAYLSYQFKLLPKQHNKINKH